jgi:hypothetical protein
MKAKIPLTTLLADLRRKEENFRDRTVSARHIRMEPEHGCLIIHDQAYPVQHQVLSLLGTKLQIPSGYLRRCPPRLRAQNANHWLEQLGDKEMFVRFDHDSVRAVLSTRYTPVSNHELVRQLLDYLPTNGATEAKVVVTPTKMVCQVILPQHNRLMAVGDEVFGGLNLMNSEVGFASVEVATFLHRLVCSNGMIVREGVSSFRRIHLKNRESLVEEIHGAFANATDYIPRALSSMQQAVEVPLEDPESTIERLPRRYGLTQDEHEAVKVAWEEEQGSTLYNVINAITGGARNPDLSLDSRLRLESLAGDLLPN